MMASNRHPQRNSLLPLPALLVALLLTSCRSTVVNLGTGHLEASPTGVSLPQFVQDSLLDSSFFTWLVIDIAVAFLITMGGSRISEWFRKKPMSAKVVTVAIMLAVLFSAGLIAQAPGTPHYGGWFAIPVTMAIGSTMAVAWSVIRRYQHRVGKKECLPDGYRRQRNLQLLAKVMAWIWSCGWVIYFVAIGIAKQPHVGSEVLLRSAVASLDLFWMDIDSNILDNIQDYDVLKGMIACASFAAVISLAALITSLVMSRLVAWLHIRSFRIDDAHNHLYLFFGINEASKGLADDVCERDEQAMVVFIENSLAGESEKDEDKNDGWKNIVSMLTHRHKTFMDAKENHQRALAIASCDVSSIDEDTDDVLMTVGLETVKKLLQKLSATKDGELHVFFLSENRDDNVRSTIILAKDRLIGDPQFKTLIYCHAPRNGINRIIEDMGLDQDRRIEVRVIDSSHLAMEHLKSEVGNHPISFVDVETTDGPSPGSVTSPFVSLVLGFNETGQEAVEFLYEYGAFVHQKATADDSYRSPFECHVVDGRMKQLEGMFLSANPGVHCQKTGAECDGAPVRLHACDYRSDQFYTGVMEPIVTTLNYVVIAIGDDETNMSAAVEILRYVRRYRKSLRHFRIFVRAYEKESFKQMDEIAKHYNLRLKKGKLKEGEKQQDDVIVIFGQKKSIFTYDLIVKDHYQEQGRIYYEAYRSLQIDPSNDEGTWEVRHANCTKPTDKATKWEGMSKIRRKESQDRSNALHAHTKVMLLEKAVGKERARDIARRALEERTGSNDTIHYPQLSPKENLLMLNLAMCEHLRWNAAHEMMGYVDNADEHKCNELTKRHNCLKPWQKLDAESQNAGYPVDFKLFDFGVVETSFKIKYLNGINLGSS